MTAVVARIVLRYAAGALVIKGILPEETGAQIAGDADILNILEVGLGLGIGAVTEAWYFLARKFGWQK